jgi:hypothetical protein
MVILRRGVSFDRWRNSAGRIAPLHENLATPAATLHNRSTGPFDFAVYHLASKQVASEKGSNQ